MKINQLFKAYIPNDLFNKLMLSYGFDNLNEERSFCKSDLEKIRTVEKVNQLTDEISKFYLPCKARLYITNLNVSKCITLFRQILRLQGLVLKSSQKYIKKRKTTFYTIQKKSKEDKLLHSIKIDNEKTVVSFI